MLYNSSLVLKILHRENETPYNITYVEGAATHPLWILKKKIMRSDQNYDHKTMFIVIVSRTFLFM